MNKTFQYPDCKALRNGYSRRWMDPLLADRLHNPSGPDETQEDTVDSELAAIIKRVKPLDPTYESTLIKDYYNGTKKNFKS